MSIVGIDVSHWNTKVVNSIDELNAKFIICKATEGVDYVDNTFNNNILNGYYKNCVLGAYHYARPENNTAAEEAAHFLNTITKQTNTKYYTIGKNFLMALDWEGTALQYSPNWAKEWLDIVRQETGVKPLLYLQQSACNTKFQQIVDSDYGLWVARYNTKIGSISPWKTHAIWQKTSTPVDTNVFNGTKEQLLKYCESTRPENIDTSICYLCDHNYTPDKCPLYKYSQEIIKNAL